jgi:hypothetical protein
MMLRIGGDGPGEIFGKGQTVQYWSPERQKGILDVSQLQSRLQKSGV